MPSLPSHLKLPSTAQNLRTLFLNSLNFYRVHLIVFAITPLITSGIMYACNTQYHIDYIDCLFNCMSSLTVTGLATVNLSTLSPVQQAILFVQMIVGSPTVVSIIMIIVRRHFFQLRFKHVIQEQQKRRSSFNLAKTISRVAPSGPPLTALRKRFSMNKSDPEKPSPSPESNDRSSDDQTPTPSTIEMKHMPQPSQASEPAGPTLKPPPSGKKPPKKRQNISVSMIKRVEGGGVGLMNPMGWYDAERPSPAHTPPRHDDSALEISDSEDSPSPSPALGAGAGGSRRSALGLEDMGESREGREGGRGLALVVDSPPRMDSGEIERSPSNVPYAGRNLGDEAFPRSRTIAFNDDDDGMDHDRGYATGREGGYLPRTATHRSGAGIPISTTTSTFPRTHSLRPSVSRKPDTKNSGFGGFPTPLEIAHTLVNKFAPKASETLTRTFTVPRTATFSGRDTYSTAVDEKDAPYISFAATVGRNSHFTGLTDEQMDELGGVEYRALRALFYIVIGYVSFLIIASFIIVAPYIGAQGRYDYVFEGQPRLVKTPWFALFQVVSAFSNTGMSLVDTSMIPFQRAYLMVFIMFFLIFAGNTAFPVLLRLTVWSIYKIAPKTSRLRETLKFLLDHPRRCFVYLFPATQTWVLALVMLSLTLTDWVCFLVLDIGTPEIQSLPVGTRISAAFLQSAAVRAAGFAIVPIAALAPAVKVLYTVMMYISVYPVALSVRATNVYEERSLGLYNEEDESDYETDKDEKGAQAVAKYLGWHARRQLAFDIWWLGFALWLICIIERHQLEQDDNASWFDIFSIIFELVSGYGTVGLSLGLPYDNYSFCGGFRKLSKLVLIFVMLRGRHRGLPVAIDRAVMLPKDFTAAEEAALEETRSRRMSRRGSTGVPDEFLASLRRGSMSNMSQYGGRENPVMANDHATGASGHAPAMGGSGGAGGAGTGMEGSLRRSSTKDGTNRSRAGSGPPSSPTALSFSVPVSGGGGGRGGEGGPAGGRNSFSFPDPRRSPVAHKGGGGGSLTPVQESSMSRANTRTDLQG